MKTKTINISLENGTFRGFIKKIIGGKEYNDLDISRVRKLLSNERARMIYTIKMNQPHSIYQLAKLLDRDFKTVRDDLRILESFGIIDLVVKHEGKRESLVPVLNVEQLNIQISL